jgi:hypothetical protein
MYVESSYNWMVIGEPFNHTVGFWSKPNKKLHQTGTLNKRKILNNFLLFQYIRLFTLHTLLLY